MATAFSQQRTLRAQVEEAATLAQSISALRKNPKTGTVQGWVIDRPGPEDLARVRDVFMAEAVGPTSGPIALPDEATIFLAVIKGQIRVFHFGVCIDEVDQSDSFTIGPGVGRSIEAASSPTIVICTSYWEVRERGSASDGAAEPSMETLA